MLELTARQERFCRAFVDLANGAYAAREAGYAPGSARQQGNRLLKDRRVRSRIADIQAETAEESCRETDVLLGKLETVYRRAMANHHFHAAARAVELQAKLTGLKAARTAPDAGGTGETPTNADGR